MPQIAIEIHMSMFLRKISFQNHSELNIDRLNILTEVNQPKSQQYQELLVKKYALIIL